MFCAWGNNLFHSIGQIQVIGTRYAFILLSKILCYFAEIGRQMSPRGFDMIDKIFSFLHLHLRYFMLWGYGWKRRKLSVNSVVYQWQDPISGLWYGEKVAMKLLVVNALDYYRH